MVLAHHKDADLRLRIQTLDAQEHIIPFVEEWLPIGPSTTVLEVGCGEGGVLLAFLERGGPRRGGGDFRKSLSLSTDLLTSIPRPKSGSPY
jgi:cyclopropane fatty-acyl-phospholipid synthase-like methyltransferase